MRGKYAPAAGNNSLGLVFNPVNVSKADADTINNPATTIPDLQTIVTNQGNNFHADKVLAAKQAIALRQDSNGTA